MGAQRGAQRPWGKARQDGARNGLGAAQFFGSPHCCVPDHGGCCVRTSGDSGAVWSKPGEHPMARPKLIVSAAVAGLSFLGLQQWACGQQDPFSLIPPPKPSPLASLSLDELIDRLPKVGNEGHYDTKAQDWVYDPAVE